MTIQIRYLTAHWYASFFHVLRCFVCSAPTPKRIRSAADTLPKQRPIVTTALLSITLAQAIGCRLASTGQAMTVAVASNNCSVIAVTEAARRTFQIDEPCALLNKNLYPFADPEPHSKIGKFNSNIRESGLIFVRTLTSWCYIVFCYL
jgi:hypothetical protein